jgi:hypothetical protein
MRTVENPGQGVAQIFSETMVGVSMLFGKISLFWVLVHFNNCLWGPIPFTLCAFTVRTYIKIPD